MLRPVLPLNLTPRDDEKVAAGVAALLVTCALMLLLGAFILAFNLLDRPLLGLSKRELGEMLIEAGPVRVRKSYAPNSGTNAAKAGLEAPRVGNLRDQRARAGTSGCHGPSSCPTRGSAAAAASIPCSPRHAYQKQWCAGLGQRLAVLQARPMANQKLMRQDTR